MTDLLLTRQSSLFHQDELKTLKQICQLVISLIIFENLNLFVIAFILRHIQEFKFLNLFPPINTNNNIDDHDRVTLLECKYSVDQE